MNKAVKQFGLGILAVVLLGAFAWSQQPRLVTEKSRDDVSVLMRAKLSSSQKVVEGLMSGDFSMIDKGAGDLKRVCDSEHWQMSQDPVVSHYRGELRRSSMKLAKQAGEENLEGAAYTYMHTLTTCINCHEYSRNVLRVADATSHPVVPIPSTLAEQEVYRPSRIVR